MTGVETKKRETAELEAFDADGNVVEQLELTLEEYYQGLHDLVDKDEYRAARGIVVIEGRLFDPAGMLVQEFSNRYSDSGAYIGGKTVHADGTVNED
jgi:hypothetical protein